MNKARLGVFLVVCLVPGVALAQTPSADAEPELDTAAELAAPGDDAESEVPTETESEAEETQAEADEANQRLADHLAAEAEISPIEAATNADETGDALLAESDEVLDDEEVESLPWSLPIYWDNEVTVRSLNRDGQLAYNPTYLWAFSVRPRWNFEGADAWLRVRQDLVVELTDNDDYNTERQLVFSDLILDGVYEGIPEFAGIEPWVGLRLYAPVSKASRAADRYFATGLRAGMSRDFEVLEGLALGVSGSFVHWFAGSNVATVTDADPDAGGFNAQRSCTVVDTGGAHDRICSSLGGASAVRDSGTLTLEASLSPIEKLSIGTSFTWWWNRGHELAPAHFETLDGGVVELDDMSATHRRLLTWFTFDVGYDVTDYLNLTLTYSTLSSWIDTDGGFQNPFFNEATSVILGATFSVDSLYQNVRSTGVATAESDEGSEQETASVDSTSSNW